MIYEALLQKNWWDIAMNNPNFFENLHLIIKITVKIEHLLVSKQIQNKRA